MSGWGLLLAFVAVVFLLAVFWRVDTAVDEEEIDQGIDEVEGDRVVSQIAAAQRLRHEAEATTDPDERARLLKFAEEAEGTAEKVRQGILSDR
jgi:hypothetical protein